MQNEIASYREAAVQTAAYLCRHQIRTFPASYGSKKPLIADRSWKEYATSDLNQFIRLVPPGLFNLAIVFGPESNLCDVEPDTEEGSAIIEHLAAEAGVRTIAYKSARGVHRLFRYPRQLDVLQKSNPKARGLECRLGTDSKGFYSICPPSLHPDTREHYLWLPGCAPWEVAPAEMPANIIQFFLDNVRAGKSTTLEVDAQDDGYLPGVGGRHQFLVHFSKSLYCDWLLPLDLCMDLTRQMSQAIGSYDLEGRGETELKNLFKGLRRPHDPARELTAAVDMEAVNTVVDDVRRVQAEHSTPAEIPDSVFHPLIERFSVSAREAQYPRNLWLMTILTTALYAAGTAVRVRASPHHEVTGGQLFAFGVGGSGSGKSRTIKALLGPVSHSRAVTTEASPEGLVSAMSRFPRGVMLEFTEGKEFFKMLGRYSAAPGQSDNSLFHKCWSGDRIWRTLQKGTFGLDNPFLVVTAAIQKINLNQMPHNDCIDGLLQRMLIYPIGDVPRKHSDRGQTDVNMFLGYWYEIVGRLQNIKPTIGSESMTALVAGAGAAPRPLVLTLNDEAREIWNDYAALKRSELVMAQYPEDHPFRADLVRHAELVLRISQGLFLLDCACDKDFWATHQVDQQDHGWLSADIVRRAIALQEWLWHHKQQMIDHVVEAAFSATVGSGMLPRGKSVAHQVTDQLRERRRRIERQCGDEWTLRDYYTALRLRKTDAEQEVNMFIREGHVVKLAVRDGQKAERFSFVGDDD